jgi:hypothetical protein
MAYSVFSAFRDTSRCVRRSSGACDTLGTPTVKIIREDTFGIPDFELTLLEHFRRVGCVGVQLRLDDQTLLNEVDLGESGLRGAAPVETSGVELNQRQGCQTCRSSRKLWQSPRTSVWP